MAEILGTEHPGDHEVLFRLATPLPPELCRTFTQREEAQEWDLARALFLVMGVRKVDIRSECIVLERDPQSIWPLIIPPAINIISSRLKQLNTEVA